MGEDGVAEHDDVKQAFGLIPTLPFFPQPVGRLVGEAKPGDRAPWPVRTNHSGLVGMVRYCRRRLIAMAE